MTLTLRRSPIALRDIFPNGSTLEHDCSPRGPERPLEPFIERADHDALVSWSCPPA